MPSISAAFPWESRCSLRSSMTSASFTFFSISSSRSWAKSSSGSSTSRCSRFATFRNPFRCILRKTIPRHNRRLRRWTCQIDKLDGTVSRRNPFDSDSSAFREAFRAQRKMSYSATSYRVSDLIEITHSVVTLRVSSGVLSEHYLDSR